MKKSPRQPLTLHGLHEFVHIGIMVAATIIIALLMSFVQPRFLNASANDNVTGWAWIGVAGGGWVSLNCVDAGACGSADYGVTIDANGAWSGSGWSSNVGWIDFDGGSCGSGASTDMNSGYTSGWAHVRSFNGSQGGFSGCINMAGSGQRYNALDGVQIDTTSGRTRQMSGYAWSGDDVEADIDNDGTLDWVLDGSPDVGLGWIDFSFAQVDLEMIQPETVELLENGFDGTCDSDATFSWNLENVDETACELTVEDVVGGSIIDVIDIDASSINDYSYAISGQYRFTLACPNLEDTPSMVNSNPITLSCSSSPQCNDNEDNDRDGEEDYNDPSCHDNCEVTSTGTYNPGYLESRTCLGMQACEDPTSPLCTASGGVPPKVIEN